MRALCSLGVLLLASCGHDGRIIVRLDAGDGRVEVARVPATMNPDVDLLFVIDDSNGMLDQQTRLGNAFPAFLDELRGLPDGLPSLHIGVVTSDLGSQGANDETPGPDLPGTGGCTGNGKAGDLRTTADLQGTFISDVKNPDGTRTMNYVGTLANVFGALASAGAGGCGFEQTIEAAKRALDNNPANAGFLRPDAGLGIIVLTDEDDCSFSHSTLLGPEEATLGPLQSFRCTRFGVTCDAGGATPDEMNAVGIKNHCHSNESSPYLMPMGPYVEFFEGLKGSPDDVMLAAIVGDPAPVEVELRSPPGSTSRVPFLMATCTPSDQAGNYPADPGVRIAELANRFARHAVASICDADLSKPLVDIARQIRGLVGDSCLTRDIALPADCIVRDELGTSSTELPACDGGASSTNRPCYDLVTDVAGCTAGSHLRLRVEREGPPLPATVTVVSCKV